MAHLEIGLYTQKTSDHVLKLATFRVDRLDPLQSKPMLETIQRIFHRRKSVTICGSLYVLFHLLICLWIEASSAICMGTSS